MKMERLTSKNPLTESQAMNLSLTDLYMRLKAYEDAEEQRRLIVLPCNVGDTVFTKTRKTISSFEVKGFFVGRDGDIFIRWNLIDGFYGPYRMDGFSPDKIGKTVFLTREEAEKALEGMNNG